jgi:hypothetical protein
MSVNGFTTGRDITLSIQTPGGTLPVTANITNFNANPAYTDLKAKMLDGTTRHGVIPDCWEGSFDIERFDPTLDNYFAQYEDDYYNQNPISSGTIYETISEADSSITQWRYTGVTLKLTKAGDYAGDKQVQQSVMFRAERRIKVA